MPGVDINGVFKKLIFKAPCKPLLKNYLSTSLIFLLYQFINADVARLKHK